MKHAKCFTGILIHDHETAMYHFGTGHGECNVHLERYLLKNTEETGHKWSRDMGSFLDGMNHARKGLAVRGICSFTEDKLIQYEARYDEIIAGGRGQNKKQGEGLPKKKNGHCLTGWRNIKRTICCSSTILKSLIAITCPKKTCGYVKTAKRWQAASARKKGGRCTAI